MSFSLPRNAPKFDDDQRANENIYCGSVKRTEQNGHAGHGIGNPLNGLFENKTLPMYKDKPYSYAASRRLTPWYRRKGVWLAFVVLTSLNFCIFYFFLRRSGEPLRTQEYEPSTSWKWLSKPSETKVDWDLRREAVRDAFKLSWDAYANNAWGMSFRLKSSLRALCI